MPVASNIISLSDTAVHLEGHHVLASHVTLESACRFAVSSLHAHADVSSIPMLTMRYWLYDLALSDVKENTVRMIVFLLLIPPFHTPIQIPNEWQLHTTIPFHQIPSSIPHELE